MFVGLDIRSDSILAVRLGEDGTDYRKRARIVGSALGDAAAIGAARAAMLQP